MELVKFICFGIGMSFVLWLLFANIMPLYDRKDTLPKPILYISILVFALGYVIDVIFNIIYGSIIFLEKPQELTLTKRLIRLQDDYDIDHWRYKTAYFICRYLINPWDEGHC